jgi:hypothetical protein
LGAPGLSRVDARYTAPPLAPRQCPYPSCIPFPGATLLVGRRSSLTLGWHWVCKEADERQKGIFKRSCSTFKLERHSIPSRPLLLEQSLVRSSPVPARVEVFVTYLAERRNQRPTVHLPRALAIVP